MLSLLKTSVLVFLLAAVANSTPIEKKHDKYIAYPIEHFEPSLIGKRYESESFDEGGARYITKLKIGSNKQEVLVMIDTGSWNLNFPSVDAKCQGRKCAAGTTFDPSESTTFKNLSIFSRSYYGGGGSVQVSGFKSTDDLYLDDGKKLPDFEFNLLNATFYPRGIFGIGYITNDNISYIEATKKAGYINKAGFSIYTGSDHKGTFLLGGVDKAKYEGELALYDTHLAIPGKSITTSNGTVLPFPSVLALDTGSAGLILDPPIVDQIFKEVRDEKGKISCDIALAGNKSFTFDLGQGVEIDVPYSDAFYWNADKTACNTRIEKTGHHGATQNVGIPLIKHIFLTNNYDTGKLGVAPVRYTDESDIVDFWF
ncbi:hypothetical protein CANMA_002621 [Candida margitis]|uniref:uncharacterized protein n=1 Tax=Candida margitis TaxID=1775924 RepID=UPI002225B84B|nr:uncharacterized protein CANMA_002621 [Candida margitis]KAI5967853.1 hypothetical protein CANMA_002621 [Candida margitis]